MPALTAPLSPRPDVSMRRVLALALPMTLSQITTPLLGLVGAAAVGHLGDPALLGAVALGAVVFDVLFWSFGSLRMATAGLTAQAVGGGQTREVDLILARALLLAVCIGIAMALLRAPIRTGAISLSGASAAVAGPLGAYIGIRILAAPFALMNYAMHGSILGRGRSGLGLVFQVGVNCADIVLTIGLVIGLGRGVAGAAEASLLAEIAGVGLGAALLAALGAKPWRLLGAAARDGRAMLRMLALNRDVTIRTVALMTAFALFSAIGARSGDTILAANAVLQNVLLVGSFFLDGFATAAEILCGQALGAGDETGFRRAVRLVLVFSVAFGAAIAVLFLAGGPLFIDVVTLSPAVRDLARQFLPYAALAPLVGATAFAFDGIFVGATWGPAMRDLMLAATAVYAAVLVAAQGIGNHGLWLALLLFLAARGIGQACLYPRLTRRAFAPGA